jgi:predicted Rossmann fold nucleotide-binding protein DprA/Smf involved in DNA uptake
LRPAHERAVPAPDLRKGAPVKLAIVGSRDFADRDMMDRALETLQPLISEVISGGAAGADTLGERWAEARGIPVRVFHPAQRNKNAFHHRNRLIVEACDALIAFWNGHSTGTRYTIDYARQLNRPVTIVRF